MTVPDLAGRVAIVTGGSRGIGRAIATALGRQGARVVVNYRQAELDAEAVVKQITSLGGDAIKVRSDVANEGDVRELLARAEASFGPIDILVNNAGWDIAAWFVETETAFWKQVIDVNFTSVLLTCRYVLPSMLERRTGRIINIGSATAKIGFPTEAVYSGAKGAVTAFSRSLAREVAAYDVTVNVVAPGPTETPLTDQFNREIGDDPRFLRVFPEGPVDSLTRLIPLGHFGLPEDVAAVVAFLAGDGGRFVTGQCIAVDGGFTM
jgi:2-hydroxycyclohexanecarboxyl-CoA dehydrogenase